MTLSIREKSNLLDKMRIANLKFYSKNKCSEKKFILNTEYKFSTREDFDKTKAILDDLISKME